MTKQQLQLEDFKDGFPQVDSQLVVAYTDAIERMFENPPRDRRKRQEVEAWTLHINSLISSANKLSGHQLYKKIK